MPEALDPYHRWLGIPPKHQPPDHYRLLGLERFESDPDVISDAADQRMAHVRTYQLGPYTELSQKILNELATARACLLNPGKKAAYDAQLQAAESAAQPLSVPQPVEESWAAAGPALGDSSGSHAVPPWIRRAKKWHPQAPKFVAVAAAVAGVVVLAVFAWSFRSNPPQSLPAENSLAKPSAPVPVATKSSPAAPPTASPPPPLAVAPFDTAQARKHQEAWAKHLGVPAEITNSIGMKLVLIPPGEFMMGSPDSDRDAAPDEKPQHCVRITKPFCLGAYEVTVGQFRQFVEELQYKTDAEKDGKGGCGWEPNSAGVIKPEYTWRNTGFEQTDQHPIVNISWNDTMAFCEWIGRKETKTYRLPTEAEWEFACRAGTTTRYWNGDDAERLPEVGNVFDAAARASLPELDFPISGKDGYVFTAPVGRFKANPFGLYDTHGNVHEWCSDWHDAGYYAVSPSDDPQGPSRPSSDIARIVRGGSWTTSTVSVRSAWRLGRGLDARWFNTGFRVAVSLVSSGTPAAAAKIPPATGRQPSPVSPQSETERQTAVARMVFRLGGSLKIVGSDKEIKKVEDLPREPFQVCEMWILDDVAATDEDFKCLAGTRTLKTIVVRMRHDPYEGRAGDKLVSYLSASQDLRELTLFRTSLTAAGLKELVTSFPDLEALAVWGASLGDGDLRELPTLKHLKTICVTACGNLTNRDMRYIAELVQLENVHMMYLDSVTDEGFLELARLPRLRKITAHTNISEQAIAKLKKKLPECIVEMFGPDGKVNQK